MLEIIERQEHLFFTQVVQQLFIGALWPLQREAERPGNRVGDEFGGCHGIEGDEGDAMGEQAAMRFLAPGFQFHLPPGGLARAGQVAAPGVIIGQRKKRLNHLLNDEGTGVHLRGGNPQDGSGSAGINMAGGTGAAESNIIQNNVFAGFDGVAAALRGGSNEFVNNYVGTQADGNVVKNANPALWCTTEDWLGGGVSVEGISQLIENNIIAGLRQEIFVLSQQPDALRVTVVGITGHTIRNNRIGVDIDNTEVGACGRGIYLSGDMKKTLIAHNTIVNTRLLGISLNDNLYDECTLRGNIIKQTNAWPAVPNNPKPEDAIQLGPLLPDGYEFFKPAKVTAINGANVSGTSGDASACPNCVIELFLDDTDTVTEALQSLAVVTATASGDWTAILPAALTGGQGIRTTSTSAQFGTIPNISKGTTTGLSPLYGVEHKIFLPLTLRNN